MVSGEACTALGGGDVASGSGSIAEYLRARRDLLRPEDVGFPPDPQRRVRGLRRSEVAELAGISLEYYTRLEQGRTYQMSETVLAGLVDALRLDESAASYFYRIALPAPPVAAVADPKPVGDLLAHLVERWGDLPVCVVDRNQDLLLASDLAVAMFPALLLPGHNVVESVFAAPVVGRGLERWRQLAWQSVAALRFRGDPEDPRLQDIVGRLSIGDPDFRRIWADHVAEPLTSGAVPVLVDGVGFGEVPWQALDIPGGHFMIVYLATPGTFAAEAIEYLRRARTADPRVMDFGGVATGHEGLDITAIDDHLERARHAAEDRLRSELEAEPDVA